VPVIFAISCTHGVVRIWPTYVEKVKSNSAKERRSGGAEKEILVTMYGMNVPTVPKQHRAPKNARPNSVVDW
jgi:hypothetical protein